MRKLKDHSDEIRNRQFFAIFFPALFSSIGSMISGFIDGLLTGSFLGSEAMAACGIAAPYFMLNTVISFTFFIAGQALYTLRIGQGREEDAKRLFSFCIWSTVAISAAVSVLGFIFSEELAVLFGAGADMPAVKAETTGYLRYLFLGMVFSNFFTVVTVALELDGAARLVTLSCVLLAAADIIGDLLNIFVFHGGLAGMGLATSISYFIAAIAMLPYFLREKALFSLDIRLFSFSYTREVFEASYAETLLWILRFIGPILVNRIIIQFLGLTAMTAMSVHRNFLAFVSVVSYGLGDAALTIFSQHYGESDRSGLLDAMRVNMKWLCVFSLPLALLVLLLTAQITGLYTDPNDVELFLLTENGIILLALSIPFTAAAKVFLRALQATGRYKTATVFNIAQAIALPVVLTWILSKTSGRIGPFMAYTVTEVLAAALGWVLFRSMVCRPETFPVPEEKIFRYEAETDGQAVELSEKLRPLCINNGCSEKTAFKISLCAEELACSILHEGLLAGEASAPYVRFVILFGEDTVSMQIRDNCADQELLERASAWRLDDQHPERFIGIRMAMQLSKEFKYYRLLNVNNIRITFSVSSENEKP